ncbi:flagellar basal body rod protein FlgC [Oleiharenicola lentus]|jgi:flagellar basal-body rod protein FlgC|uniref:Flagellar basal-body rod protein FlgC n=1 Tax=Oleiharenicola lentus TaxID=2508720 RepID=A0A4Q1C3J9_9BACT|nr:flagellar basal body rod protein FlgC [Oleiharenicola lentus]RXK52974.1 flagellar basal body rod protein FlgC [Oleiharenicola lentus]
MNLISGVDITSGALTAQKIRLDIVAQNIANAQTTRTPEGGPYKRKIVSFENELVKRAGGSPLQTISVSSISADKAPGQAVYNPQHPDAGPDGTVQMPNVNLAFEMVDLITASRAYEANLSVVKNSRTLAMKTLEIGK